MGTKAITLQLPTDYTEEQLRTSIAKNLGLNDFSYQIETKSLDARKKANIHWQIRLSVSSKAIKETPPPAAPPLTLRYGKRTEKALVVGSGPAGFFAALVLQKSGIETILIERGAAIEKRARGIREFERTGVFNPISNYAFGEGGAGTFSDGKLTSRTKNISKEKQFMLSSYIRAGAPEEIQYMSRPHLGSDNLRKIVEKLRIEFQNLGGTMLFETRLDDLYTRNGRVTVAITNKGEIEADYFVLAPGHSAFETYRMLLRKNVKFRTKNFAIGCRVEHRQEIINLAQWGRETLPGVKAAEYRLTSNRDGRLPVYTFCMCPGGLVIPATAYANTNIVNGMSFYSRAGKFANAACVAGINLEKLTGRNISPLEALAWLGSLEEDFYRHANGYQAPFCSIQDFIDRKEDSKVIGTSYPFGLKPAALWELLPSAIADSIREALRDFSRKVKGFETGIIMGLESKTSSPIQVIQDKDGLCSGFDNLYMVGEGGGYAGGIISSGTNGIKAALRILGMLQ